MKECNCGNYKPYIETMEAGVIHAPSMPFNACVNCYGETMKESKPCEHGRSSRQCNECDLQAENDELRASNRNLRKELEYFTDRVERGTITSKVTYNRFKVALKSTPAQSLADIRAEAVIKAAESLCVRGAAVKPVNYTMLVDYANKIKEGE